MHLVSEALSYRVLSLLSHSQNRMTNQQIAQDSQSQEYSPARSAKFLEYFGGLLEYRNKSVLEIGCGSGDLCVLLAQKGCTKVVGVDSDPDRVLAATRKAREQGVDDRVEFICSDFTSAYPSDDRYDIIFSQAAFEHFPDPLQVLRKSREHLVDGGKLATVFGPLWLSPWGAHMWNFTRVPWVHFVFREDVVLKVRQELYRPGETPMHYEDIRGHLNRLTVRQFKKHIQEAGLIIDQFRVNPAQDRKKTYRLPNNIINKVPLLQELGSFQVLAIVSR